MVKSTNPKKRMTWNQKKSLEALGFRVLRFKNWQIENEIVTDLETIGIDL